MTLILDAQLLYQPPTDVMRFLPEGPTSLESNQFSWVAIQHGPENRFGSLNLFDMSSQTNRSFILPGRPGFAKPTDVAGKFVVGAEHELALFDIVTHKWTVFCDGIDQGVDNTTINDGYVFRDNIVFGTKDLEFKTRKAGLYLFRGRDNRLIKLLDDRGCSNGKAFIESAECVRLLDIDSLLRQVVEYELDIDRGELVERRVVLDFTGQDAVPDGMTITADHKSIIISFYNPTDVPFGETRQYDVETSQLMCIWRTPRSPQATCPALIKTTDGAVKLIITTAVEFMPAERRGRADQAGMIFVADTPFTEIAPQPRFPLSAIQHR